MRKLIVSILLASAAASPALARPDTPPEERAAAQEQRAARHEERQQAREQRVQGGEPARVQQQAVPQAQPQFEARRRENVAPQQPQPQWQGRSGWDRSRFGGQANVAPQPVVQPQPAERNYRGNRGGYAGQPGQVQQNQATGGWTRDRGSWSRNRDGDFRQRQAEQQTRNSSRWSGNWNRDWRNDRRYDWRRYRDTHRSIFHIGIYYDPFGYGYQPFNIGYRLSPNYFGQQYWIDPAMYQLPYPPPGTIWVRYWNDALLVDMYSGEVIDVIHDFFW